MRWRFWLPRFADVFFADDFLADDFLALDFFAIGSPVARHRGRASIGGPRLSTSPLSACHRIVRKKTTGMRGSLHAGRASDARPMRAASNWNPVPDPGDHLSRAMTYLDTALLDLTERCCQRFQLLTGKTNVWLAGQLTNVSIIVYFVWALMYAFSVGLPLRMFVISFCGVILYALTQTVFKVPIESYETQAFRRVANGYRNPRRLRDALLRIPFLTLSILLPFVGLSFALMVNAVAGTYSATDKFPRQLILLTYSLIVLTTVILYVLACDPLPPCAGKVTEWLQALRLRGARSQSPSSSARARQS
jgi:hypothetical protein